MFSFVKSVGKNIHKKKLVVGKKNSREKIRHWQKNSSFFADLFSSGKVPILKNSCERLLLAFVK